MLSAPKLSIKSGVRLSEPRSSESSADEFANRGSVGDHGGGSAGEIGELCFEGEAEVSVPGGEDIVGNEWSIDDFVSLVIGGTDDLSHRETSAGEEEGHGTAPMFSSGLSLEIGEARGVGHFSHNEEEDVLGESALMEIVDQCRDDTIDDGEAGLHFGEDIPDTGVIVPAFGFLTFDVGEIDGDESDPGFDEPAGQEALLADLIATVGVAEFGRFLSKIEGVAGIGADEDIGGLAMELVHVFHEAAAVEIAAVVVELFEQIEAMGDTISRKCGVNAEAGDLEFGRSRISADVEGFEASAEIGGSEIADVIEGDMGGDVEAARAEELVDDGPHVGMFGGVGDVFDQLAGIGGDERVRGIDVAGAVVAERTDEGELVSPVGEAGEMFADLDAGDVGGDRSELASIFGGGLGLEVEGLHVAGSTPEPEDDHGLGGTERECCGLDLRFVVEELSKSETSGRGEPGVEESTSGEGSRAGG